MDSSDGYWGRRFTAQEMAEIRRLARDEEHLFSRLVALLKRAARHVPFARDVLAAWHCARDPATPTRVRVVLISAIAYFVMPVDMVPDLAPLIGFSDDAAVLATAIATVASAIRPEHRAAAERTLSDLG